MNEIDHNTQGYLIKRIKLAILTIRLEIKMLNKLHGRYSISQKTSTFILGVFTSATILSVINALSYPLNPVIISFPAISAIISILVASMNLEKPLMMIKKKYDSLMPLYVDYTRLWEDVEDYDSTTLKKEYKKIRKKAEKILREDEIYSFMLQTDRLQEKCESEVIREKQYEMEVGLW